MDNITKHIKVESEKENLKKIRDSLFDFLYKQHIPELDLNMVLLATDELCANVIIHANKNNKAPYIDIDVEVNTNEVIVQILDEGKSFNILSHPDSDLKTLIHNKSKGGIGIMLVKKIMDRIEYIRKNNRNVLRLYKKFSPSRISLA